MARFAICGSEDRLSIDWKELDRQRLDDCQDLLDMLLPSLASEICKQRERER
jgi:hypothetical protein